ncbi:MAG: nucleotidyltransferase family protein [Cyclobacteriaceae bacterium]|nr:nucleotidyltransferase family protein [Cyclobacteriaceae bacterium]
MKEPVILILAAGSSSRMGQSKQLLKINEQSMLRNASVVALESGMQTIVVLGANEGENRKTIEDLTLKIIVNPDWENGMGNSLKKGISSLPKNTDAAIVMVCDQPLLNSAHLKRIREKYQSSDKRIIASYYSGTFGVPTLFDSSLFEEIKNLTDDQGAKKIIQLHQNETLNIEFQEGAIDLDTPDDFRNFVS